jgi:OOP family OmpA-OmpF porin
LTCLFGILFIGQSFAQTKTESTDKKSPKKNWLSGVSVSVNGGSLLFYGDIRQYDFYPVSKYQNEREWGYGLTVNKFFNPVIGLQGQLLNGRLAGTRRKQRVYFNAEVFEYSLNAVVNLSNISFTGKSKDNRKFTLYALAGLGLTNFKTKLMNINTDKVVSQFGYGPDRKGVTERTTEVVIPVALGLKYRVNKRFDVGLEASLRNVNSDKLDARVVVNSAEDKYGYTDLFVTYKFGSVATEEDVEWQNPLDALYNDVENLKTKVDGLTNDQDKDGVADIFDKDNNTSEGSKVYGDGTAVDTDGDGVFDSRDAEPFSSKGARVDANGKEVDSDGDGVPDSRDIEANTAKGSLVNFQGVKIPTATVAAEKTGTIADIAAAGFIPSIFFDLGSTKIDYKHLQNLAAIARILKTNPGIKLTIIGNADAIGTQAANDKISRKRADAVKEHLVKVYGVEENRLITDSKGSNDPLAKSDANKASLFNRRVDFKISK